MGTSDYKMEIDNPTKEKAIKTAVNDISTDRASISKDVNSLSNQLPALVATRSEINWLKNQTERFDTRLADAAAVIEKGVTVRVDPAKLSESHINMLDGISKKLEIRNRRWTALCEAIASTGKKKVIFTSFMSILITTAALLLIYENSPHVWAHRALVAAENMHKKDIVAEYSKAYTEMRGNRKVRKDAKKHIEEMESEAEYIGRLERILSDYTEDELEVWEYIYRLKSEQMVHHTCYHPSSNQKVKYRLHTTPEGTVTKVEMEKKIKNKSVWEELKIVEPGDIE